MGIRKKVIIAAFLLWTSSLGAQTNDYDGYMSAAGDAVMLLRGRAAVSYNLAYNGTYFRETPEFRSGELRYNGKTYHNVMLNVDAVQQDLLVHQKSGIAQVVLNRECVEYFIIDGRKFVNLQYYVPSAPRGYFEVLYDGKAKFFKYVEKWLKSDMNTSNIAYVGEYRENYNPNVFNFFIEKISCYYLSEDGILSQIKHKSLLMKKFDKSTRKSVSRYMDRVDASDGLTLEQYGALAIKYAEELK